MTVMTLAEFLSTEKSEMQVSDASDLHAQRWKGNDSSKQNRGVKEPHSFMYRPSRCVLRGLGAPVSNSQLIWVVSMKEPGPVGAAQLCSIRG